jgi:hypothetical protein
MKMDPQVAAPLVEEFPWPFLSAFYDGDGSYGYIASGVKAIFNNSNPKLSALVLNTLRILGFNPKLYVVRSTTKAVDGKERSVTMHNVELLRQTEVQRFFREAKPVKMPATLGSLGGGAGPTAC